MKVKKAASLMVYCGERSLRGKGEGGGGKWAFKQGIGKELARNWCSYDMYRVQYSNESFVVSN